MGSRQGRLRRSQVALYTAAALAASPPRPGTADGHKFWGGSPPSPGLELRSCGLGADASRVPGPGVCTRTRYAYGQLEVEKRPRLGREIPRALLLSGAPGWRPEVLEPSGHAADAASTVRCPASCPAGGGNGLFTGRTSS